jgi:hypothetical protein
MQNQTPKKQKMIFQPQPIKQNSKHTVNCQCHFTFHAVSEAVVGDTNVGSGVSAMQLNNLKVAIG